MYTVRVKKYEWVSVNEHSKIKVQTDNCCLPKVPEYEIGKWVEKCLNKYGYEFVQNLRHGQGGWSTKVYIGGGTPQELCFEIVDNLICKN